MVATKIIYLYASVWEPLFSNELTGLHIIEFSKKLPKLRAALSCCVCRRFLSNREPLTPIRCGEHFACKVCVGKQRDDKMKCKRCDDWSTYQDDNMLTEIIQSYQKFCYIFLKSEHIVRLLEVKHEVDPKFDTFQLLELIEEGLKGLSREQKRIYLANFVHHQPVRPIDNEKKGNYIANTATAETVNKSSSLVPDNKTPPTVATNVTDIKKAPPKRACRETTPEKPVKTKSRVQSTDEPNAQKTPLPVTAAPSTNSTNYLRNTGAKNTNTFSVTSSLKPTPKPAEPTKQTGPSAEYIKIEIETTPEKPKSPLLQLEDDEEMLPVPLQDPLRETPPPRPIPVPATVPKPQTPNIVCISSPSNFNNNSGNSSPTIYRINSSSIVSSQPSMSPQIIQIAHSSGGIRTLSLRPQQIRLAGLPGRTVQIIGTARPAPPPTSSNVTDSIRGPAPIITSAQSLGQTTTTPTGTKRKILLHATTPHDFQKWPDTSKVIQFNTADLHRFPALAGIRSSLYSVSHPLGPVAGTRTSAPARPMVSATIPLVRPPNVSTMITTSSPPIGHGPIFTTSISKGAPASTSNLPFIRSVTPLVATSSGSAVHVQSYTAAATTVTQQVPEPTPSTSSSPVASVKRKTEGCRCGNATPTPGKLTCIGQRCACYADRNACSDCKCKGCKNPYVPGTVGKKLLQGVRAFIDPQTNQTIPIIATPLNHAPSASTLLAADPSAIPVTVTSNNPMITSVGSTPTFGNMQNGSTSMQQPVPPFQFIPVRIGPNGAPQYLQISNPQALQQMPIILSASGHIQGNPSGITIQGIPVSGLSTHQISQMQSQRIAQVNIKPDRRQQE